MVIIFPLTKYAIYLQNIVLPMTIIHKQEKSSNTTLKRLNDIK